MLSYIILYYIIFNLREFVENSRHPATPARLWVGLNCGSWHRFRGIRGWIPTLWFRMERPHQNGSGRSDGEPILSLTIEKPTENRCFQLQPSKMLRKINDFRLRGTIGPLGDPWDFWVGSQNVVEHNVGSQNLGRIPKCGWAQCRIPQFVVVVVVECYNYCWSSRCPVPY